MYKTILQFPLEEMENLNMECPKFLTVYTFYQFCVFSWFLYFWGQAQAESVFPKCLNCVWKPKIRLSIVFTQYIYFCGEIFVLVWRFVFLMSQMLYEQSLVFERLGPVNIIGRHFLPQFCTTDKTKRKARAVLSVCSSFHLSCVLLWRQTSITHL